MTPAEAIQHVAGISLITPTRLANLVRAVESTVQLPGDMAELGVYRGGSALVIASVCPLKRLHLFDTFCGLPHAEEPARNPTPLLKAGDYAANAEEVETLLRDCNVSVYPGVFPLSARHAKHAIFGFVHVDCDLYKSARAAIEWFWPRLVPGGVMFFDDYGCEFTGVTDAVNEAFRADKIIRQRAESGVWIGCYVSK